METIFFTSICLCLVGLIIRSLYETLKEKGKVDPKNGWVFAIVFTAMCLMLISWPVSTFFNPAPFYIPTLMHSFGLGLAVAGLGLAGCGMILLKGVENISHLVTTGLFSKIRHPMYYGFMLWILGWVLFNGSWITILVAILCIANILYWKKLEEDKLASMFGEEYRQYRKETWL